MSRHKSLTSELRAAIDFLIPDLSGLLTGKRIRQREFDGYLRAV